MTAMADEANKVCYVTVQAPGVGVKIGNATFEVGAPVNDVLKANGVKKTIPMPQFMARCSLKQM